MSTWYNRSGNPIDMNEWGRLLNDNNYKRVDITEVDGLRVSTVWLGIDHAFGGGTWAGPPIIFETMVFKDDSDVYCTRYGTERDAQQGHDDIVNEIRAGTFTGYEIVYDEVEQFIIDEEPTLI